MFDTVVFNRIADGVLPIDALQGRVKAHATHVQRDEISQTKDSARRKALESVFGNVTGTAVPTASFVLDVSRLDEACFGGSRIVPTDSAVWDVSAWDQAKWAADDNLYIPIKGDLDSLNGGKKNNTQDALIAETAIKGGYILVTDDRDLAAVTKKYRGECLSVLELWQRIK
ncbi:MAG: hypothetical protein HY525_13455 [Betaproteobacteria bacterium]|nr:hypothetical protein [Betaproteobacteria bacterium]